MDEAELKTAQAAAPANEACGYDTIKFKRAVTVGNTTEDCFARTVGYKYEKTVYSSNLGSVNSYWLDSMYIDNPYSPIDYQTDAYTPRHVEFIDGLAVSVMFGE